MRAVQAEPFESRLCRHMCYNCQKIPNLKSFSKRLVARTQAIGDKDFRDTSRIRNEYLTSEEKIRKLSQLQEKLKKQESSIFFLSRENIKLKIRRRSLKESLMEYAKRGSMKSICFQLNKAADEKMLDDKHVLKDMLESCAQNFHREKQGRRYKKGVKEFYEVIMYWGGPRLGTFIVMNLFGPEVHSMWRWRKENLTVLLDGMAEQNFKQIGNIYREAMEKLKIGKVPVQLSEDETAIVKRVVYDEKSDQLIGFCGVEEDGHKCIADFVVDIGDGEAGYHNIVNAFNKYRIGSYGRLIMINPLCRNLPKVAILVMPTCNCFDTDFVRYQWETISMLYQRNIESVLGPLIAPASDGDSRRRKLFLSLMTSKDGERFQPISSELGFIYTARMIQVDNGYTIRDCCDQDSIHCHKKLINHLDHKSRTIKMGRYTVHINHIREVYNSNSPAVHGLTKSDIDRDDRQNWRSAQRLSFTTIQELLRATPNTANLGTETYLKIIWYYVEIYFSECASLLTRVKYASIVCTFLGIWRAWIAKSPRLSFKEHMISRETCIDVVMSAHFAVSYIVFCRDNYSNMECHLEEAGTDCCETYFSTQGQWIGNRHNYTYSDMRRNRSHGLRIEQLRADPAGPEFAKPHPKGESIWTKQYPAGQVKASMKEYFRLGEEIVAWKEGIKEARQLARDVGMLPDDQDNIDFDQFPPFDDDDAHVNSNLWFYNPYSLPCNNFTSKDGDDEEVDEVTENDKDSDDLDGVVDESNVTAFGEQFDTLPQASGFLLNSSVLNDEEDIGDEGTNKSKASPTITLPGGKEMYKATLVSLLNDDPKLSADRLKRVRQRNEYNRVSSNEEVVPASDESVCLFSDYVIVDNNDETFFLGRVERMRRQGKRKIEYKLPEPFDSPNKNEISVLFSIYSYNVNESSVLVIRPNEQTIKWLPFRDILCGAQLTVAANGTLFMTKEHVKVIQSNLERLWAQRRKRRETAEKSTKRAASRISHLRDYENFDGEAVITVTPTPTGEASNRRASTRTRRVMVYDS